MAAPDSYRNAMAEFEEAYQGAIRLGQWLVAAQTLSQIAVSALGVEGATAYFAAIDAAIQLADAHDLYAEAARLRVQRFQVSLTAQDSGASLDELKQGLPRLLASLANTLMLQAEQCLALDDPDTAGEFYANAAKIAENLPAASRWLIELNYGRFLERQSQIEAALAHAEKALQLARTKMAASPEAIAPALMTVVALRARLDSPGQASRAEAELAELQAMASPGGWIAALCLRSQARFERREFAAALADADAALAAQPGSDLRRMALIARLPPLVELGRGKEALSAAREAIGLVESAAPSSSSQTALADSLHLAAAWLNDSLGGSPVETFALAEAGRARRLGRELARLGVRAASAPAATFADVRAQLAEDRAAMLMFGVVHWGTLAILLDFEHAEPRVFRLDFAARDLARLLSPPKTPQDSRTWTGIVYAALPELSAGLLHPLAEPLDRLAGRCQTLYIVPDSFLYRAPFAGLRFPGASGAGAYLVERFALALAPSAATLAACRARRGAPGRDCLAYGVGEAGGLYFAAQARRVSELAWQSRRLLDERCKPAELLAEAAKFSVIHLACHGSTAETIYDPLRASQLEMFPPDFLRAGDVHAANPPLQADLVFLNACQSGRFRMSSHSEPDGFWRAFLKAGARSLIAALTHVDPTSADALALAFYAHWLSGETKAAALQSAQLSLLRAGEAPERWASHILIGDAG